MIWKKRRPTIGRQVIIINVTLTSVLLCILAAVLFYLNGKVQEETHAHNQQILNTISRNLILMKKFWPLWLNFTAGSCWIKT